MTTRFALLLILSLGSASALASEDNVDLREADRCYNAFLILSTYADDSTEKKRLSDLSGFMLMYRINTATIEGREIPFAERMPIDYFITSPPAQLFNAHGQCNKLAAELIARTEDWPTLERGRRAALNALRNVK